jgi:hypothetical protein
VEFIGPQTFPVRVIEPIQGRTPPLQNISRAKKINKRQ